MTIEAMKQALDALNTGNNEVLPEDYGQMASEAIAALRAAIEQAEKQEPVAWKWKERVNNEFDSWVITASEPPPYAVETHPLYTAPCQWQGLTDEDLDIRALWDVLAGMKNADGSIVVQFARAIEAKLKEKNG